MRGPDNPPGFRRTRDWWSRSPQHETRDTGCLGGQRQSPARNQIELVRMAPYVEHHRPQCIASQRIRRHAQRHVDVGGMHRHHLTWVQPQFGEAVHGERAGFHRREILPDPHQRSPHRASPSEPCNETGRCGRLPRFKREHFMQDATRQSSPKHCIHGRMSKRNARHVMGMASCFQTLDLSAQTDELTHARAGHGRS